MKMDILQLKKLKVIMKNILDIEQSDLERELQELKDTPEEELMELAKIYEARGLTADTALEVAKQLTAHNALEAHAL